MNGEDREFRRWLLERAVAVPKLIGERANALRMARRYDIAVVIDVRDIGEMVGLEAMLAVGAHAAEAAIERPKPAGEGHLLVFVEILAAKHQHAVAIHRRFDGGRGGNVDRLAQI